MGSLEKAVQELVRQRVWAEAANVTPFRNRTPNARTLDLVEAPASNVVAAVDRARVIEVRGQRRPLEPLAHAFTSATSSLPNARRKSL